jgi:putative spermidine/putrescine transport system ATP-binding protein
MNILIEAHNLRKSYGFVTAVHDFSHSFAPGRITAILGPSGSGKSTTLAMIAGLIDPDGGSISLNGTDITRLPAERRDFGLVFQNYSLFPHLSVVDNVEFGLRVRGIDKAERRRRAMAALEQVHIPNLADRRILQISGGEQQRVALARALAFSPRVLLLDEPLSALDAKLREGLRAELGRLLNELSLTAIYVTHDQVEAMSLGHELIIMRGGRIEQSGTPLEVYTRPATPFVATFLGSANLLDGEYLQIDGQTRLRLPFVEIPAPEGATVGPCQVMVRPEDIAVVSDGNGHLSGEVISSVFLGNQARLTVTAGGNTLIVDTSNEAIPSPGTMVSLQFREAKLCIMPKGV